jgi:hypothetical protein
MSAEASGFVWKRSPYKGPTFTVHLAIADTVNDLHEEQFWMSVAKVARKARLSPNRTRNAIHELLEDGYLELVHEANMAEYRPNTYRFIFKGVQVDAPTVEGATTRDGVGLPHRVGESTPPRGARSQVGSQVGDPKVREKRGWSRVPPTEQLTEDRIRMAREIRLMPLAVVQAEWAAFKDHDYPAPKKDVDATWRNWCRKVKAPLPVPPPAPGKRSAPRSDDDAKQTLTRLGDVLKEVGL